MSYDPTIGQFLSEDPIGFEAGDANKYRYVGNKVTTHTDWNGLKEVGFDDRLEGIVEVVAAFGQQFDVDDPDGFALAQDFRTVAGAISYYAATAGAYSASNCSGVL